MPIGIIGRDIVIGLIADGANIQAGRAPPIGPGAAIIQEKIIARCRVLNNGTYRTTTIGLPY